MTTVDRGNESETAGPQPPHKRKAIITNRPPDPLHFRSGDLLLESHQHSCTEMFWTGISRSEESSGPRDGKCFIRNAILDHPSLAVDVQLTLNLSHYTYHAMPSNELLNEVNEYTSSLGDLSITSSMVAHATPRGSQIIYGGSREVHQGWL